MTLEVRFEDVRIGGVTAEGAIAPSQSLEFGFGRKFNNEKYISMLAKKTNNV